MRLVPAKSSMYFILIRKGVPLPTTIYVDVGSPKLTETCLRLHLEAVCVDRCADCEAEINDRGSS